MRPVGRGRQGQRAPKRSAVRLSQDETVEEEEIEGDDDFQEASLERIFPSFEGQLRGGGRGWKAPASSRPHPPAPNGVNGQPLRRIADVHEAPVRCAVPFCAILWADSGLGFPNPS